MGLAPRLILSLALLLPAVSPAVPLRLAENGRGLSITISAKADEATRHCAEELASMLRRITGADFPVRRGTNPTGIALGTVRDFPDLLPENGAPEAREDYLIRSEQGRLLLIGQSPAAVSHAVWDLLHRLGYRQLLPGPVWEIVPSEKSPVVEVEVRTSPSFHTRRIWSGYGLLPERAAAHEEWSRRNRATSGIALNSGHSYLAIMARHRDEFARHPEYLALVGGSRKEPKFCIANEGLRRLVVKDALAQFERQPRLDSVSCDPSDGGGWCECPECAKLGSISDRALLLANEVAEAVNRSSPGRLVGMYAYSAHSPPPSLPAHPQVVVSVATSFIRGGYTVENLLDGWHRKVRTLGIREYYAVHPWDRDLPGASRGGNTDYLKTTIPQFHRLGARFMSAEASDNFGPNGLGYYLAARMLWDIGEAGRVEELTADFLEKAFGPARQPMEKFYQLLDGKSRQPLCDDLLGRMYRLLDEAGELAPTETVRARVHELALYTRYAELFLDYSSASGTARQQGFENLLRYAWQIRRTGMVHTKGLWQDLAKRDKTVTLPAGGEVPSKGAHPWKSEDTPEVSAEDFIRAGIIRRHLLDFEPVAYSNHLVPAARLGLPAVPRGNAGSYSRGVRDYWTWNASASARIEIVGRAGLVYTDRGKAKLELFPAAEPELKSTARLEIAPDGKDHALEISSGFAGLHRLEVNDGAQGTRLEWGPGIPMTIISSQDQPAKLHGSWHLYFYVPAGTRHIGGFSEGEGVLLDPEQRVAHRFDSKPGYFKVPVPPGGDARLWSFKTASGTRTLMTVPPCLARDGTELLLPSEVVSASKR